MCYPLIRSFSHEHALNDKGVREDAGAKITLLIHEALDYMISLCEMMKLLYLMDAQINAPGKGLKFIRTVSVREFL